VHLLVWWMRRSMGMLPLMASLLEDAPPTRGRAIAAGVMWIMLPRWARPGAGDLDQQRRAAVARLDEVGSA